MHKSKILGTSTVMLTLLAGFLLTACQKEQQGWRRTDLMYKLALKLSEEDRAEMIGSRFLGESLRGGRLPNGKLWESGFRVQALELAAGRRVSWPLTLGRDAYFAFVPLSNGEEDCRPDYRVAVQSKGEKTWLHEGHGEPTTSRFHANATVFVDLAAYEALSVELLIEGAWQGAGCSTSDETLVWGSPGIYDSPLKAGHTAPQPEHLNVLMIGLDTLRADHLGVYGRNPSPSPSLDRLASESDVWLDAFSAFNVTTPSFASIFTGLYGKHHGVYDLNTPLPEDRLTLAEIYQEAGYSTHAIVSAAHLGPRASGLGQGFDTFVTPGAGNRAAERSIDMTMGLLQKERTEPFFVFLHLFDAHNPYTPPEPFAFGLSADRDLGMSPEMTWKEHREVGPRAFVDKKLGGHQDLYLDGVAYLDWQAGRLFDFLDRRGLLETTVVVIVADHGENLGEQGVFFRHAGLWDATVRVPLMIRWPGPRDGSRGQRHAGLVQTIDLFPTLLNFFDFDVPKQDGEDLLELTTGGKRGRRLVFAETTDERALMVRTRDHLLTRIVGEHFLFEQGSSFFFDLQADPEQKQNLAGQGLDAEAQLGRILDHWQQDRAATADSVTLSAEELENLRSLGYLGN